MLQKTHHSWLSNVVKDGEDSPEFTGSKEKINSVFDLKKALESGFARLNKFISNLNLEDWKKVDYTTEWKGKTYTESLKWILWHLIEHDIHHRAHIKM